MKTDEQVGREILDKYVYEVTGLTPQDRAKQRLRYDMEQLSKAFQELGEALRDAFAPLGEALKPIADAMPEEGKDEKRQGEPHGEQ